MTSTSSALKRAHRTPASWCESDVPSFKPYRCPLRLERGKPRTIHAGLLRPSLILPNGKAGMAGHRRSFRMPPKFSQSTVASMLRLENSELGGGVGTCRAGDKRPCLRSSPLRTGSGNRRIQDLQGWSITLQQTGAAWQGRATSSSISSIRGQRVGIEGYKTRTPGSI